MRRIKTREILIGYISYTESKGRTDDRSCSTESGVWCCGGRRNFSWVSMWCCAGKDNFSWVSLWCCTGGRNLTSSSANKLLFCCRMSVKWRSSEDAVILRLNVDVSTARQVFLKPFTSIVFQSITSGLGKRLEKKEYTSFNALFRSKSAQENCFTHV